MIQAWIAYVFIFDIGTACADLLGPPAAIVSALCLGGAALFFARRADAVSNSARRAGAVSNSARPESDGALPIRFVATWMLIYFCINWHHLAPVKGPQRVVLIVGSALLLFWVARPPASLRTLWLCGFGLGVAIRLVCYFSVPLDAMRSDQLVVVQQSIDDLLQGRNPYHTHQMPHWQVPLSYLTVTLLAYTPFQWLGVDIRFANLLCELGIAAIVYSISSGKQRDCVLSLWAASWLGAQWVGWSVDNEHAVLWLMLAAASACLAKRKDLTAAVFLGLSLATSPLASVVALFVGVSWLRRYGFVRTLGFTLVTVGVAVVLLLPFALWNWKEFFYGVFTWHNDNTLYPGIKWEKRVWEHQVSLAGFFWAHDLVGWLKPLQALALFAVVGEFFWRRAKRLEALLPSIVLGLAVFLLLNPMLWPYLHWTAAIVGLVTLATLSPATESTQTKEGGAL